MLALAQHLDDLSESFLMSCFHNGRLRTMKANYVNNDGDVRIIRPLCYARERQTRAFAEDVGKNSGSEFSFCIPCRVIYLFYHAQALSLSLSNILVTVRLCGRATCDSRKLPRVF